MLSTAFSIFSINCECLCPNCVTPHTHTVIMLLSAAKQVEKHLAVMLAGVKSGEASTSEVYEVLALSKVLSTQIAVFQTIAATVVAKDQQHSDGGAGVLRSSTGMSKQKARKQIRTAETLEAIPNVREAAEEGRITPANADALARASRKTNNPEAVQTDRELLRQAEVLPDDLFARRVRTWTALHQHDRGESDYSRMRAKRNIRIWDGGDGMTHLHAMFDPITGARIRNRLNRSALRLYRKDKKRLVAQYRTTTAPHKTNSSRTSHNSNRLNHNDSSRVSGSGDVGGRSFQQCLADVFDKLVSGTMNTGGRSNPVAEILVFADISTLESHNIDKNNTNILGLEDVQTLSGNNDDTINGINGNHNDDTINGINGNHNDGSENRLRIDAATNNNGAGSHSCFGNMSGIGELVDGTPIPPSILDRLMCSSPRLTGLLFNGPGRPLWCGRSKRVVTAAQLKALKLRDRNCVGCGAHHSMCQAHHIIPWSKGGKTNLDNLVLVCYECHHKIHDNNWQITTQNNRFILQPPNPKTQNQHTSRILQPPNPKTTREPPATITPPLPRPQTRRVCSADTDILLAKT